MEKSPNDIGVEEIPRPYAGVGEAVLRITLTTICGTDLHNLGGEYPVKPGLVIGHEPVGVITELGPGVTGYAVGDRVLVGAVTPCGQCQACLSGHLSQCGHGSGYQALGGWRFGNTINGRIAVGWLIVEDLAMVLTLVLLPAVADALGGQVGTATHAAGAQGWVVTLGFTLAKVAAFVAVAVAGRQLKLGAGEVFGEMALISGQPRSADVTALDYSTFAMLSGRDFRQLLRKYPEIRAQIVSLAAQRQESDRQVLVSGLPPEAPRPS